MIRRMKTDLRTTIYLLCLICLMGHSRIFAQCNLPLSPVLSANGLASSSTAPLIWSDLPGWSFDVEFKVAGTFNWNINHAVFDGNTAIAQGLTSGTLYDVRVFASRTCSPGDGLDDIEQRVNSNTIQILTRPLAPALTSASSGSSTQITCNWSIPSGIVSGFYLDVSASNLFSSFVLKDVNLGSTTTSYTTAATLAPGTNYFYRVRAYNSTGPSDFSVASSAIPTRPASPTLLAASDITSNSFKANWNAVSGIVTSYLLDVSAFSSFTPLIVSGLSVSGTSSLEITNLLSGTTYYYRVRAVNASGASDNSNPIQETLTLPAAPVLTTATSSSTSSISMSWNASTGIVNGYLLDLSSNSLFTSFILENVPLSSGTTMYTTPGTTTLDPATNYYYRLRAFNASGNSGYSSTSSAIPTRPSAPVPLAATEKRSDSFKVNWNSVSGVVSSYRIDVSRDHAFSSFVAQDVSATGNSYTLTGLLPGTLYYYRVRAINSSGPSVNSTTIEVLTAPAAPQLFDKSTIGATGFTVNWTTAATATHYDLFVYRDAAFTDPLPAYNPKILAHPTSSTTVTSLLPSTTYYLRLRARNATDSPNAGSDFISIIATTTAPGTGNVPDIRNVGVPSVFIPGTSAQITATIDGGTGILTARLVHRKKSTEVWESNLMNLVDGAYRISIMDEWVDEFGMDFYIEVEDDSQTKVDVTRSLLAGVNEVNIPLSSFGKQAKNYQIISIPYVIGNNIIQDVFGKVMGSYDKKRWRLSRYASGTLVDYEEGLAFSELSQGQGYWFISRDPIELKFDKGTSYATSLASPVKLRLNQGWNQVGNPFPFDISWQDVLNYNSTVAGVSSLYIFDPLGSFDVNDELKLFGGGFVFSDAVVDLIFPVVLPRLHSGRIGNANTSTVSGETWSLPIHLTQDQITTRLNGVGMSPQALEGKDQLDKLSPPAFFNLPQFSSPLVDGGEVSFNMVPVQDHYLWKYTVKGDPSEIQLSWDSEVASAVPGQLILLDRTNRQVLNMAARNSYSVTAGTKIEIYFSTITNELGLTSLELGKPYPNPFENQIIFPIDFFSEPFSSFEIVIVDALGREIFTHQTTEENVNPGLRYFQWTGKSNEGLDVLPGVYCYKVSILQGDHKANHFGRIIKR